MKKNYLFTLAALLLGSTIANAQKPLDGYEAPSFTAPGNCGKVISLSTSGALENYTDLKDLTTGKIFDGRKHNNHSLQKIIRFSWPHPVPACLV